MNPTIRISAWTNKGNRKPFTALVVSVPVAEACLVEWHKDR